MGFGFQTIPLATSGVSILRASVSAVSMARAKRLEMLNVLLLVPIKIFHE
jgi:hypothetical protein